jgi:hypothetical protein
MITIKIDGLKETQQYLDALAQGQLRYGIAKGLNELAQRIQVNHLHCPSYFTL